MRDTKSSNAMWGGRFAAAPDAVMAEINASIGVDKRLWREDIAASRAHASMLGRAGIVSEADAAAIDRGLAEIAEEYARGELVEHAGLEDIHMHVEARLKEKIGAAAGRLHTARSRNDQVATDFRLWVRDAIDHLDDALIGLAQVLLTQAEEHAASVMPGCTHLQAAQPVTLGHHLMAYAEMLRRDRGRFADCGKRLNECPLGAAALAGTGFPIDRAATAAALGFDAPMRNSMDAVSDRDFALEFLSAAMQTALHLSRLAEEIVIWASQPYAYVSLPDAFSTGSSIMPQKRNPDAAELVRAKAGVPMGALIRLATVMKGLPLAYQKDMQEDKAPVFEAFDALDLSLAAMTGMLREVGFDTARMRAAAELGFTTATDLADWLVREAGVPFREAHHITGAAVALAERERCGLAELPPEKLKGIDERIDERALGLLSVEASVASRTSFGGTAPERVREAIAAARRDWGG